MLETGTSQVEVEAVTEAWAASFNRRDAATLAALYSHDAVLWGTLAPDMVSTPEGVRQYFDAVCGSPLVFRVIFDEQLVRSCGESMLNSGRYTFTFTRDGQPQILAARFSMALRKKDDRWLIVDHHSSQRPQPALPADARTGE